MKKASLFVLALFLSFSFIVGSASAATELNTKIAKVMGVRYLAAGTTPKGFDCSGFTRYIFAQFNVDLSHSSRDQATEGEKVAKSDLRAGDLVFFETGGGGISHVGIYVGDGSFVHSASNKGITKNKLSEKYYAQRYVTARRILSDKSYATIATEQQEEKPVVKKDDSDKPQVVQDEPQSNDDQDTVPVTDQEES